MGWGQGFNGQARRPVDPVPDQPGGLKRRQYFQTVSDISSQAEPCQVDFYVPKDPSIRFEQEVCRLALMAWQRNQQVLVIAADRPACAALDEMMWQYPAGRFLPHAVIGDPEAANSPIRLGLSGDLQAADVVINLCPEIVPQPERFGRIMEFVPFDENQRGPSRLKFRTYREMGLKPLMNEING
jgi:DNA polymerase-3 subunit chi